MALQSGEYVVKTSRRVVVWPKPDANGDGPEVWTVVHDDQGNEVGRNQAVDSEGRQIYEYLPPKGFQNRPGYEHQDNYVEVTDRGLIKRASDGQAISIRPGTALVYEADGTTTLLTDDWQKHVFAQSHDVVRVDE